MNLAASKYAETKAPGECASNPAPASRGLAGGCPGFSAIFAIFAVIFVTFTGVLLPASGAEAAPQGELLATEGKTNGVEFARPQTNWVPARIGQKLMVQDRLRTLALSRATVRLAELGRLRVNELTTLEILAPTTPSSKAILELKAGALYFFTRGKPREFLLQTPYAIGASRGTEFLTVVGPDGRTVLSVFDGEVELANALGTIVLTNGEQGIVQAGQAPVKTAVIQATNIVQWWLYYPGILDSDELPLTPAERTTLAASLAAYQSGNLKQAVDAYPAGRTPQSDAESIYFAGLLLSVGQVDQAEKVLASLSAESPLAGALRQVIATVSAQPQPPDPPPASATEWLAISYAQQPTNLAAALLSAKLAAQAATNFGFAWARVAELEFSFGHIGPAKAALEKSLTLSPRNAQALALRGFILTAENRITDALTAFEQAIAADPALANGWLGRGLCRIRNGDATGGRNDLQTAATLESNRSLLRSYLGKAFGNADDPRHAQKELALAQRLDPKDPTPWLYSALLLEQQNRPNEGVDALEKSLELNDNRRIYRSQLLLDQDRAVRSSSLATIYEKAGLDDVAAREAATAVTYDYGNYSAHLFLANSLSAQLDPTGFNLRNETAWLNELWLANLFSPPGVAALSQSISQQEYSRLFESKRFGLASDTFWRSDGQIHELASQYGVLGDTSYSLDADYKHNDGVRPNNEFERTTWQTTVKQDLTFKDSLLLQVTGDEYHSGDNFQYYDQASARPDYHLDAEQLPTLLAGYHREWSPGVHTLLMGTRLSANEHFSDKAYPVYDLIPASPAFPTTYLSSFPFDVHYDNDLLVYGAELSQVFQGQSHLLILGARFQSGEFNAHDQLIPTDYSTATNGTYFPPDHYTDEDFQRVVGYGYYTAELPDHLLLTGGLAYDDITYPQNFQSFPISTGQSSKSEFEPKAALIWNPLPEATLRGIYARSLGGVSIDQSFRIEPVQLAGFDQTFRNVLPPSLGAPSASRFEVFGAALDLKFKTRTYISIQAQLLQSDSDQTVGLYDEGAAPPVVPTRVPPGTTLQQFDYKEQNLAVTINQLVGNDWSLGVRYQFERAHLVTQFPEIPLPALYPAYPDTDVRADLHQLTPYIVFNHPSGFFARAEAPWYSQHNSGYSSPLPGDEFVQVNLFAGFRFPRQYGEFTVGLLNVGDQDYHLNPLNYYAELPRERVWSLRLRLSF